MAVDISDPFTNTNGTALGSHTTYTTWTLRGIVAEIQSNACDITSVSTGVAASAHTPTGSLSADDYYAQIDLTTPSSSYNTDFNGICARRADYSTTDSDGYFLFLSAGNTDEVKIFKRVSASWTELDADGTGTFSDNTSYTLRLEVDGSASNKVSGTVDGSYNVVSTDTAITAKNDCGIGFGTGGNVNNDSTYDNFEAGTLSTPITIQVPTGPLR